MKYIKLLLVCLVVFTSMACAEKKAPKSATNANSEQNFQKTGQVLEGHASWYGPGFHGRKTANGEIFNKYDLTAAHKTLPFGTILEITNPETDKTILVRVNDRGPYVKGRILDLSQAAAQQLGFMLKGSTDVVAKVLVPKDIASVTAEAEKSVNMPRTLHRYARR